MVGGIVLGGLPAVAAPPVPVGDHGPEGVSLQVGITGITPLSVVDTVAENPVPGGTLVVRGQGFVPFVTYDVHLHSTPTFLGTVTARADGTIELVTTIPLSTLPGPHYVVVTDPLGPVGVVRRPQCSRRRHRRQRRHGRRDDHGQRHDGRGDLARQGPRPVGLDRRHGRRHPGRRRSPRRGGRGAQTPPDARELSGAVGRRPERWTSVAP